MDRIDEASYSLLPIGIVTGGIVGLILLEPDFGTAVSLCWSSPAPWCSPPASATATSSACAPGAAGAVLVVMSSPYRAQRMLAFLDPWADPLGDGFQMIQSLIAVGTGRRLRPRADGRRAEALLPARAAHRFHLRRDRRGARASIGATVVLVCFCVIAWRGLRDRAARARSLRRVPRARADDDDRVSGVLQHQRGARAAADQGHSAAVRQLRRIVAADQPARHGDPAQRVAARVAAARGDHGHGDAGCMSPQRVVIAGGGTGGHLFPGIAVARELRRRVPETAVTFAGTARGIEARVVPREGFDARSAPQRGPEGQVAGGRWRAALSLLPLSGLDAWRILSRRRPQLVIGVGGYSSGRSCWSPRCGGFRRCCSSRTPCPASPTGCWRRCQRRRPSRSSRRCRSSGGGVCQQAIRFVPSSSSRLDRRRGATTGAAEGSDLWRLPGRARDQHGHGGGGAGAGSHAGALAVTHQTGERDLELVRDGYRRAGLAARVEPFLYDMDRRDERRGPGRLPRRGDDARRADGGGQAGDSRSRCRRRPTITSARTPRCSRRPARPS